MGATVFIGYPDGKDLHITLNRNASDVLEILFDEALQNKHAEIHEKVMMYLPLDQINFIELSKEEFNVAIKCINKYLLDRKNPNEGQLYQQDIWNTEILSLMKQDERYQSD